MASRRMLVDEAEIWNYIGEVNDVAQYQITHFSRCCCVLNVGADNSMQGDVSTDNAQLYIFDTKTVATDESGNVRTYIPYEQFVLLADKSPYWTISDTGTDYLLKQGYNKKLRINSLCRLVKGTKRMWHFEVDAR